MSGAATIVTGGCDIDILDPCECLNNATTLTNGQFSETIQITAVPGDTWTVTAVSGLYTSTSLPPPSTPTPVTVGTTFVESPAGSGIYLLPGRHVDALGYTITVRNARGLTLTIGNTCEYPNPVITTNLDGPFCVNTDPITLTGDPGDANTDPMDPPYFTVNGVETTTFDPGAGVGTYVIKYIVNGGEPDPDNDDPGCIQSVSRTVNVVATPTNIVCNDLVTVALDQGCSLVLNPDDILEGSYGCFDNYIVQLDKTLPLGNGPWVAGVLGASDVHKTYAVRVVVDANGNGVADLGENSCWGNISIEDKLPPVLTCACTTNEPTEGCTYDCADLNGILNGTIFTPTPVAIDGCEGQINTIVANPNVPGANLYKEDEYFPGVNACSIGRIVRTWTAKDSWGNSVQCTQIFYLEPFTHEDIDFPDDITIDCAGCGDAPGVRPCDLASRGVQYSVPFAGVYPLIATPQNINVIGCGVSGGLCNLGASYTDTRIDICAGTFKIQRHWVVLDWCTNETWTSEQLIKVVDDEGPEIACPADMTVSTNPSQCCATVDLPNVIVEDRCSPTAIISAKIRVYTTSTCQTRCLPPTR